MKNDLKKKEFSINSDVSIADIEKANEKLKSLTIKVSTNKRNFEKIYTNDRMQKLSYCNEFILYEKIVKEKIHQIHFINQSKYWSFETQQERDRIYEKIKPYFEFKEVEEIEID